MKISSGVGRVSDWNTCSPNGPEDAEKKKKGSEEREEGKKSETVQ